MQSKSVAENALLGSVRVQTPSIHKITKQTLCLKPAKIKKEPFVSLRKALVCIFYSNRQEAKPLWRPLWRLAQLLQSAAWPPHRRRQGTQTRDLL